MQPLIDFWSHSSMSSFLNNQMAFKKMYVLKQYDNLTSPSALVGSAAHKAIEMYLTGLDESAAIDAGFKVINEMSDIGINYGKTGSREQIIGDYTQAINMWFEERPTFYKILGIEDKITSEITDRRGEAIAMPAKAIIDVVSQNKSGEIEVYDHKFVRSYTDPNVDDFKKWLQGMFNFYLVKAKYGEWPARIIFGELKISRNKNGEPQLQPYTMEFSEADFATFERLYNDCTRQLNNPDMLFLPNPNDMFDGNATFELYRQGIMGIERPVVAPHKTQQVAYADKQFVASAHDRGENTHLTIEERIRQKLMEFKAPTEIGETIIGPSITQYTFKPSRGVAMSTFLRHEKDIALAIEADRVRVVAPIPGTSLVGVEVPSMVRQTINLEPKHLKAGTLSIPIGVNVRGEVVYKDLSDMPHLLIAGATGAGKSVMMNVLIRTLTGQLTPEQLQLVLIDPKQVEFAPYEDLPHLLRPVVFDNRAAAEVLESMVKEMETRYELLRKRGCRSIEEYNKNYRVRKIPKIVILLDEFADLMMGAGKDNGGIDYKMLAENINQAAAFKLLSGKRLTQKDIKEAMASANGGAPTAEHSIIRIAQKARAVGIHLVLATQRPSADVVTGLIKANIPTKIAFMTTNKVNSQVILDTPGAEELTGKGDMLFADPSHAGLQRLQGLYAEETK